MIGEGEILSVVLLGQLVILLHGVEEGFLVANHPAELQVIGNLLHIQDFQLLVQPFSTVHRFVYSFLQLLAAFEINIPLVQLALIHDTRGRISFQFG